MLLTFLDVVHCSNVDRLRDFIKHVYVDRRYSGERGSDKPPRGKLVRFSGLLHQIYLLFFDYKWVVLTLCIHSCIAGGIIVQKRGRVREQGRDCSLWELKKCGYCRSDCNIIMFLKYNFHISIERI